jgi:hypothetical protein
MKRRVKITRWGCEDVRGAHAVWSVAGRKYIGEVMDIYSAPVTGAWMLCCRHMDHSPTPDVAASYVELLERTYENAE